MNAIPALRAIGCPSCRLSALRLFVRNSGPTRAGPTPIWKQSRAAQVPAPFSTFRPTSPALKGYALEEQLDRTPAEDKHDEGKHDEASEPNNAEVPWYLQVDAPRHPTLLHEPPPLPDIPDGSPKLMEPLVKHVSEDLGLDDLTLLDLRELDPPPALGPDLIMLFGTARSERHLHVSADRLVRWLRGYGISAKADGLLGRNELKTRLRRQARKAKLLGNAGVTRGGDDGISTGWICVNLGTIGGSDTETVILDEKGRPTGFGVSQMGTTVVIQFMTSSRRAELDLETLWLGKLRRSQEKNEPAEVVD